MESIQRNINHRSQHQHAGTTLTSPHNSQHHNKPGENFGCEIIFFLCLRNFELHSNSFIRLKCPIGFLTFTLPNSPIYTSLWLLIVELSTHPCSTEYDKCVCMRDFCYLLGPLLLVSQNGSDGRPGVLCSY